MSGLKSYAKPNIVVVGGSFVGTKMVDLLAPLVHETHNILLVEKNSHFQNLFAFPRLHSVSGFEHKAFIPFTSQFFSSADVDADSDIKTLPSSSTKVIRGEVTSVLPNKVVLKSGEKIPYEYLVLATGTGRTGTAARDKKTGIRACQRHQQGVKKANRIVVVGGGAFGVQLVTDLKTWADTKHKHVTLVHSHEHLMNRFHPGLHEIVMNRCNELDINVVLGQRVEVPRKGFPNDLGREFDVMLSGGGSIKADLVVLCTGPQPLSSPLRTLSPSSIDPHTKFIRVAPTMQITTPSGEVEYPNVFAIGDVAKTGAHKAAKPGYAQAEVVKANIVSMIKTKASKSKASYSPLGGSPMLTSRRLAELRGSLAAASVETLDTIDSMDSTDTEATLVNEEVVEDEAVKLQEYSRSLPGIHLSLGIGMGVLFYNPRSPSSEPEIRWDEPGKKPLEINCARLWALRAPGVEDMYS